MADSIRVLPQEISEAFGMPLSSVFRHMCQQGFWALGLGVGSLGLTLGIRVQV